MIELIFRRYVGLLLCYMVNYEILIYVRFYFFKKLNCNRSAILRFVTDHSLSMNNFSGFRLPIIWKNNTTLRFASRVTTQFMIILTNEIQNKLMQIRPYFIFSLHEGWCSVRKRAEDWEYTDSITEYTAYNLKHV